MRKVMRSVVVGVTFSVGGMGWSGLPCQPPAAHAQEAIPWSNNLEQARQQAHQSQRLVLIHFWNDNCAPCVGVERNVFSRPEVARGLAANYVPVKIKVDDQPDLARKLRVDRWPLDIIITPEGQEVTRTVSPQDPVRYLAVADRAAATARQTLAAAAAPVAPPSVPESPGASFGPNGAVPSNFVPVGYGPQVGPMPNLGAAGGGAFPTSPPPNGNVGQASPYGQPPANGYGAAPQAPASAFPGFAPGPASPTGVAPASGPYGAAPIPAQTPSPGGQSSGGQFSGGQFAAPPSAGAVPPGYDRGAFNPNGVAPNDVANVPSGAPAQFASASNSGGAPQARFASAAQPGMPSGAPAASGPSSTHDSSVAPAGAASANANPPLGLDGFCPVTLYDKKKWKRADARWGVVHRDRTYLFAGPEEQKKFLANPDKFSPMLSGFDPVHYLDEGKFVAGRREHGVWYQDQMYLFADEGSLQQFWTAPSRYIPRVEQAMRSTATSGLTQR